LGPTCSCGVREVHCVHSGTRHSAPTPVGASSGARDGRRRMARVFSSSSRERPCPRHRRLVATRRSLAASVSARRRLLSSSGRQALGSVRLPRCSAGVPSSARPRGARRSGSGLDRSGPECRPPLLVAALLFRSAPQSKLRRVQLARRRRPLSQPARRWRPANCSTRHCHTRADVTLLRRV